MIINFLRVARFGRYTVAALESKIESYEKEARQLHKALERSDSYIEDLQGELKKSRTLCAKSHGKTPSDSGKTAPVRKTDHNDLDFTGDSHDLSPQKWNGGANLNIDESSFRLEMPSPVSPDLVKQCFGDQENGSRSCKKRLEFALDGPTTKKLSRIDSADISDLTIGSPTMTPRTCSMTAERDSLFAAPSCDSTLNDTLDPTLNEFDLSDCMKLMDAAEKNVEQRRCGETLTQSASGRCSSWR